MSCRPDFLYSVNGSSRTPQKRRPDPGERVQRLDPSRRSELHSERAGTYCARFHRPTGNTTHLRRLIYYRQHFLATQLLSREMEQVTLHHRNIQTNVYHQTSTLKPTSTRILQNRPPAPPSRLHDLCYPYPGRPVRKQNTTPQDQQNCLCAGGTTCPMAYKFFTKI